MILARIAQKSYGQVIRLTLTEDDGTALDISGASTKEVLIKDDSDDSVVALAGSFHTDGTDGILNATITDGTIDALGSYFVQAHVVSASAEWWSELAELVTFQALS